MKKLCLLQVLRAVAAALVVVDHAFMKAGADSPWAVPAIGAFGVYIFFVISGFIIFHTSGGYFGVAGGSRQFLLRRFTRVAPMYYLATLLLITIDVVGGKGDHTIGRVVSSFLFIPYWGPHDTLMRPSLGQGWTLVYEMFFYVCFGLCMLHHRKKGVVALVAGFLALSCFGGVLLLSGDHFREASNAIEFYSSPIILLFIAGVLLGIWHARESAPKIKLHYAVVIGGLIVVLNLWSLSRLTSPVLPIPALLMLWLSAAALVFLCAFADPRGTPKTGQ